MIEAEHQPVRLSGNLMNSLRAFRSIPLLSGSPGDWMVVIEFQQVPQIPIQVFKNSDRAIRFFLRLSDKLYSPGNHLVVVSPKIISLEK